MSMSSYERCREGGISSVCSWIARPPIKRIGTPSACAASSRRPASATMSARGEASSAFDTLHQLDPGVADVDEVSTQDAVVRFAARVHAKRRADLPFAPRLVDVAVDREDRLTLLDQAAHGGRTARPPPHAPALGARPPRRRWGGGSRRG